MALLKTKEVAKELGVSQTTILRWVKGSPSSARRDRLGHFVFGDTEIALLRRIQASVQETGRLELHPTADPMDRQEDNGKDANANAKQPAPIKLLALPLGRSGNPQHQPSDVVRLDASKTAFNSRDEADHEEGCSAAGTAMQASEESAAISDGNEAEAMLPAEQPHGMSELTAGMQEAAAAAASEPAIKPSMQETEAEQPHTAGLETEALLDRIGRLESSLSRKADEVVSFQLLEHRRELEEMRQTIKQLAASVEKLKQNGKEEASAPASPPIALADDRPKKRSLFRAIFG